MKQKSIITLVVILAMAGVISYGIIWYRRKISLSADPAKGSSNSLPGSSPVIDTKVGYILPKPETYGWWINKLGHAKFPLGLNSRGVEVVKVQETLNALTVSKRLNAAPIDIDGVWGNETDTRFKTLFPGYNMISQYMFMKDFDPNGEILK